MTQLIQRLQQTGRTTRMGTVYRYMTTSAKAKRVSRVRGTRDVLVDELQHHREVLDVLQQTVERYGFRMVR